MNELDNLKKKFLELVEIAKTFAKSYAERVVSKLVKGENIDANLRLILTIVIVSVVVGFVVGFAATKGTVLKAALPVGGASGQGGLSLPSFFSFKKTVFQGKQTDGSFIFSDFEKPADVNSWKLIAAQIEPSSNFAWQGAWSGKVTFLAKKDLSAITLDDLGKSRNHPSDWSGYDAIQFYAFQPGNKSERLVFMATDVWGKQYEETLNVSRGKWEKLTIPVKKMSGLINIKKVNQLSISRRESGDAKDFYFDDIRLLPAVGGSGSFSAENMFDYGFDKRKPTWLMPEPQGGGSVVHVPFVVKSETNSFCQLCPTEGGIPLPMGEVKATNMVRLRNAYGEDIPFQARVLAHWPDRSIRWLGLSFETTLAPFDGTGYFLDYGPSVHTLDFTSSLKITEDHESIKIDTGVLEAVLDKKAFYLFDQVAIDRNKNGIFEPDEAVTSHAELTLGFRGKEFRTDLDSKTYQIAIEEKGPQRVVIKASGWFQAADGSRYCQAIVRYYFYQGKSYVKLSHTLIYTGYPENKQYAAYQMLKLPDNETIDRFGLRLPYHFSDLKDEKVFVGLNQAAPIEVKAGDELSLFQKDYDLTAFQNNGATVPTEKSPSGWMDVSNESGGVAVAVRHFRENFPKAFKLDRQAGQIQVDLWPKEAGPIDLATSPDAVGPDDYGRGNAFGLAKTHDLMLYFHAGNAVQSNALNQAEGFMEPLIIRTNPYWIDATGVLGRLYPEDQKYATEERMLERLFDWAARQPKNFKWYGMLNFGDTLTWWRDEDEAQKYKDFGWHPVGRWGWYNCEGVGTHTGALLQFIRSGKWKYFQFGENLAKHIMDVDTVHYNTIANDRRLKGVLDERYSKVGAMHRHSANHWSGRTDEASHTHVLGIVLYYYLTGNERALEVAKEIGEYFLGEPFSYIERADVVPNRAMSNALWGDVLLYELTWDERYKKEADKIVKIFLKGQQPDGSFLENYNPIANLLTPGLKSWSGDKHELYMAGYLVGALISYHELTQDEGVKDMFLRLIRYLAPTEYSGPTILNGLAYAYLISKDPFFIAMAEDNLKIILDEQQFSSDPLMDGLIYPKQIYHRPMALLSTVPYVFGALEEKFAEEQPQPK